MGRPRPAHWTVVSAVVAAVVLGASSVAMAGFSSSRSATHTVSTATLQPPTNPGTAAGACTPLSDSVVVSWTRTASSWADGYEVLSAATSGGPYTVARTVSGRNTESATVSGLGLNTTYYFVVRATKQQWRSASTIEVARTTRLLCL